MLGAEERENSKDITRGGGGGGGGWKGRETLQAGGSRTSCN